MCGCRYASVRACVRVCACCKHVIDVLHSHDIVINSTGNVGDLEDDDETIEDMTSNGQFVVSPLATYMFIKF